MAGKSPAAAVKYLVSPQSASLNKSHNKTMPVHMYAYKASHSPWPVYKLISSYHTFEDIHL